MDLASLDDQGLMMRWIETRDMGAYRLLYGRHRSATYAICRGIAGQFAADDAFQEAWLKVSRETTWRPTNFRGWVTRLTARTAIDVRRKWKSPPSADPGPDGCSRDPSPEHLLGARQALQLLVAPILEDMVTEQQQAWLLRFVEEKGFKEIAAIQGVPEPTAKTRLRLAQERIYRELASQGVDPRQLVEEP